MALGTGPGIPRAPHHEATYRSVVDAMRRTRQEWEGIRLTSVAEAIREGLGPDTQFLIKALLGEEDAKLLADAITAKAGAERG